MIPRYIDQRIAVYDDFLSASEQEEILRYLDCARFRRVLPEAWGRAYRLTNGEPLVGVEVVSEKAAAHDRAPAYPTGTALDILITRMLEFRTLIEEIVGPYEKTWTYFTLCPHVYPVDSGLGWHTDGHCAGAYIYYAHPLWDVHWGGELLVGYTPEDCAAYTCSSRGLFRNEALESALKNGMGYYFAPTPNRMIFLRGHTPHMITRVTPAAGSHARLSLSGFFLTRKPEQAEQVPLRTAREQEASHG